MNENLRFQVADNEAKKLSAALGISDERSTLLTETMRGYIKDDEDANGDVTKMRGIDGIMVAMSDVCETPQELAFICYAFGNFVEHRKHCPFHGARHSEQDVDNMAEDAASAIAEAIFGRKRSSNPFEGIFGDFGHRGGGQSGSGRRGNKGVIIVGHRPGDNIEDILRHAFGQ